MSILFIGTFEMHVLQAFPAAGRARAHRCGPAPPSGRLRPKIAAEGYGWGDRAEAIGSPRRAGEEDCLRHAAGGTPNSRLKARLKAASAS
jgi:hypothetical protein